MNSISMITFLVLLSPVWAKEELIDYIDYKAVAQPLADYIEEEPVEEDKHLENYKLLKANNGGHEEIMAPAVEPRDGHAVIVDNDRVNEADKHKSLCDNPYIHAADRLHNNTVRVYRDNYFWDLVGIPDRDTTVKGPFKLWYKNMKPTDRTTSFQTIITGQLNGVTFRYSGEVHWSWWEENGGQRTGGVDGETWKYMPRGGFNAVYNDGNMDNKAVPHMIAFADQKVYYFVTEGQLFYPVGDTNGTIGGQFGEKFPGDLTAAFAYNSTEKDNYLVYLFKRDIHCVRKYKGVENCTDWRNNTELFGCYRPTVPTPPQNTGSENALSDPTDGLSKASIEPTGNRPQTPLDSTSGSTDLKDSQNFVHFLLVFYYLLKQFL